MLGTKTSISSLFLFFIGTALVPAQTAQYFPLEVGNSWVYRVTEGRIRDTKTVRVDGVENRQGNSYYRVEFFGRTYLLRYADADTIVSLNMQDNSEAVWLDFGAPAGQDFRTAIDDCTLSGVVDGKEERVTGVAGTYENALKVSFKSRCADAGLESQHWVPNVGLVQQLEGNITGALKYELTYSRTGPISLQGAQVAFTVGLDQTLYKSGPVTMEVRLTLRNAEPKPLHLVFPSGQRYDLKIFDQRDNNVYTWSADKLFLQAIQEETVDPGTEKTFAFTAEIPNLSPGRYRAVAFLTSEKQFSGTIEFEVAEVTIQ